MRTAESNATYFLSAIVSSRSAVKKEETTFNQEGTNKLNPSTVASTGNGSKTESCKRKKKKDARSVEEIHTNNDASTSDRKTTWDASQASRQSEGIGEPTCRNKKFKNKNGKTQTNIFFLYLFF